MGRFIYPWCSAGALRARSSAIIQLYNQMIRHLQEIELVPNILQSFSFTLYKSYICPLIQTFCASPNSFHLRADCSLCNTTLKPLTTKIQCYTVLIYSTCNQIKTSSCSSSYSRYYELVYLSVCVLVVFSGRALTVVLQKNHNNKHILWFNYTVESLWRFESKFLHRLHSVSVQYNL